MEWVGREAGYKKRSWVGAVRMAASAYSIAEDEWMRVAASGEVASHKIETGAARRKREGGRSVIKKESPVRLSLALSGGVKF